MTEIQTYDHPLPAVPDVKPTQVAWIANVRKFPVRAMQHDEAKNEVGKAIIQIAPYLSETPEPHVVNEFASVFKEAYPALNPQECAAAVRMQVTGKLGESDNRIFYAGKFSVSTMCAILNAYLEWRKPILAALVIAEDEARREQERQAQKMAWVEAIAVDKAAFLRGEYGVTSWEEIPVYWLKWANQDGLLQWEEGEAATLRDEAQRMATAEAEHQNLALISDGRIDQILKGERFLESIELRAKVIRSKLAVWRKLIQSKNKNDV